MKVILTIQMETILDAGMVEEFIRNKGLKAQIELKSAPNGDARTHRTKVKRKTITKEIVAQVEALRGKMSQTEAAAQFGISSATVGRIFLGKQALQPKRKK